MRYKRCNFMIKVLEFCQIISICDKSSWLLSNNFCQLWEFLSARPTNWSLFQRLTHAHARSHACAHACIHAYTQKHTHKQKHTNPTHMKHTLLSFKSDLGYDTHLITWLERTHHVQVKGVYNMNSIAWQYYISGLISRYYQ